MFTASDIDQLRESLPECDFAADSLAVPALHPYLQFYGINPLEFAAHDGAALHYSAGTFDSAGFRIFCQYFCVSRDACRGTVFVLHGYYDHGGLYGTLLRYLLHKGYGVVLFDLPGHGLSSGDRAAISKLPLEDLGKERREPLRLALARLPVRPGRPMPRGADYIERMLKHLGVRP